MNSSPTSLRIRARTIAKAAWDAERRGDFEAGLLQFSEDWASDNYFPPVEDLSAAESAQLLLRFGSLLGYQGHFKKIKDSQLRARDIFTSVLLVFDESGDESSAAECENHIALTYYRTGEFAEARTWLEAAKRRNLDDRHIHRLASIMYEMLVNVGEQRFSDILRIYHTYEPRFRELADDWIGASFYANAGVGFMEAGRPENAIECFEIAEFRSGRSSIKPYLASIQNELAHVYQSIGRYEKAHYHVDQGIQLYREIGDESREGMLLDTKASIYLSQGDIASSVITAEAAIATLTDGENKAFLAEAIATKAKALVWQDEFTDAVATLFEAAKLAETYSGREFAKTLISHFEVAVKARNEGRNPGANSSNGLESGQLSLVLPAELAGHTEYRGIRINNDNLQCVGVMNGDLVIAVEAGQLKRGDLVAVEETDSGEISCGFYDLDFGILCLETCDTDPRLFDQDAVSILGKIIGIAAEPDKKGTRKVVPIGTRPSLPEV